MVSEAGVNEIARFDTNSAMITQSPVTVKEVCEDAGLGMHAQPIVLQALNEC
jgi:hypothetical protein